MKILFFIESLRSGGKERRLVELLIYLKQNTNYDLRLILTENEIHYSYVHELDIPIDIIKRKYLKKDPSLFFRFYRIAKQFNPDIIHTWGTMPTFYAIPTKLLIRKPLLANLISNAKKSFKNISFTNFLFLCDVKYADTILGNSMVGFKAYGLQNNPKMHLIYNGVHLERFKIKANKDKLKKQLNISTPYIAIMVASASKNKDYDLFLDVAKQMANIRNDITFIGVGGGSELNRIKARIKNENIKNIILTGRRNDIESLIKISDIALLFSPSEGISNAIIEYMALGKPVITTDLVGGSREIIEEGRSGYIMNPDATEIAKKIDELINNPHLREKLGARGKEIIQQKFSIKQMGEKYIELYKMITQNKL